MSIKCKNNQNCYVILVISLDMSCIDNLPPFVHQGEHSPLLPVGIQALVPSYRFSCEGLIHQWGIAVNGKGRHDIHLQVWRPTIGERFELIGSNVFNIKPLDGERLIYLKPDPARRLSFMSGDVIGFYLEDNMSLSDDFRIEYHENATGVAVEYQRSTAPLSSVHRDSLSFHSKNTAPIITVHLGECAPQSHRMLHSTCNKPCININNASSKENLY